MLLTKLSAKLQAEIEATNRGEKRLEVTEDKIERVRERERYKADPNNPRSGAIDPTKLEEIPDDFFISMVTAQDNISEPKRRNDKYSHVSELLKNPCPRRSRLADDSDTIEYENATGGHRIMWKIGRAVEAHIRQNYIKAVKGKGILGKWTCKCEKTSYEGFFNSSHKACAFCRTAPSEYQELTLYDHEAGVCGNPDFLIVVGKAGKLRVIEIKSMNGEDYDNLERAMPDHVYQGSSYRRLLMKAGHEVDDEITVIYCTKKFKFGKPYKQFNIDATQQFIENVLDSMWETATEIHEARKNKTLPPREKCTSPNNPDAKKCQFATDCFMRD